MASNDTEWVELKSILVEWIDNHAEYNIDDSFALWLDTSGKISKKYKVLASVACPKNQVKFY